MNYKTDSGSETDDSEENDEEIGGRSKLDEKEKEENSDEGNKKSYLKRKSVRKSKLPRSDDDESDSSDIKKKSVRKSRQIHSSDDDKESDASLSKVSKTAKDTTKQGAKGKKSTRRKTGVTKPAKESDTHVDNILGSSYRERRSKQKEEEVEVSTGRKLRR